LAEEHIDLAVDILEYTERVVGRLDFGAKFNYISDTPIDSLFLLKYRYSS
jgi:hypothetical protein